MPLGLILRNRLKYALAARESIMILNDREGSIKVD